MDYVPGFVIELADRIGFAVTAQYNSQTNAVTGINVQAQDGSTASDSESGTLKAVNIRDFTVTITVQGGPEVVLNLTADSKVQINGATIRERIPRHIVRSGPKWDPPYAKLNDSRAAGPYLVELASFGYSQRDLIKLWKGNDTKQARLDKSPKVQELVGMISQIRLRPFGIGTINRILKIYQHIDHRDVQVRVQEHVRR